MPIADLFNTPLTDRDLLIWAFHNNDAHAQIIQQVFQQKNIQLQTFILDPIPPDDQDEWLQIHQEVHAQMNSALGLPSNDISEVDFKNRVQMQSWIWLHANEHRAANLALKI